MVENKKTLVERLRARFEGKKIEGEKGLALLDVLIGVALFAIIAVIAVSAISQYRARAYESGAVSDARAIGIAMEAAYTDNTEYPALTSGASGNLSNIEGLEGVTMTKNNSVGAVNTGAGVFAFCVEHTSGAWAVYNSVQGGVTAKGRSGGCDSADAQSAVADLDI